MELKRDRPAFETELAAQLQPATIDWWDSLFDEFDWRRFTGLHAREMLQDRTRDTECMRRARCTTCPNIVKHVSNS